MTIRTTEQFIRWDAADYLKSEEDILNYLEACAAEDAGDGALIRASLGDIARARLPEQDPVPLFGGEGGL